jgi:hypothetical protein
MKQSLLNLLFSLIAFSIAYSIALLTGLQVIQQAILFAFLIQWLLFIPAYYFQTEKFYDLTGSATYLFIVIYISFQSYSAINVNMGSILLASCIILWAARLGSFTKAVKIKGLHPSNHHHQGSSWHGLYKACGFHYVQCAP